MNLKYNHWRLFKVYGNLYDPLVFPHVCASSSTFQGEMIQKQKQKQFFEM